MYFPYLLTLSTVSYRVDPISSGKNLYTGFLFFYFSKFCISFLSFTFRRFYGLDGFYSFFLYSIYTNISYIIFYHLRSILYTISLYIYRTKIEWFTFINLTKCFVFVLRCNITLHTEIFSLCLSNFTFIPVIQRSFYIIFQCNNYCDDLTIVTFHIKVDFY